MASILGEAPRALASSISHSSAARGAQHATEPPRPEWTFPERALELWARPPARVDVTTRDASIREITTWFDGRCAESRNVTGLDLRRDLVNAAEASFGARPTANLGRSRVGRAACSVLRADVSSAGIEDVAIAEPAGAILLAAFVPTHGRVRMRVQLAPGASSVRESQMTALIRAALHARVPNSRTTIVAESRTAAFYEPSASTRDQMPAQTNNAPIAGNRMFQASDTDEQQLRFELNGDDALDLNLASHAIQDSISQIPGVDVLATPGNARTGAEVGHDSVVTQSMAGATVGAIVTGDRRTEIAIRPPRRVATFDPLSDVNPSTTPRALNINVAVEVRNDGPRADAAGVAVLRIVSFVVTPRRRLTRHWSIAMRRRIMSVALPEGCSISWR